MKIFILDNKILKKLYSVSLKNQVLQTADSAFPSLTQIKRDNTAWPASLFTYSASYHQMEAEML